MDTRRLCAVRRFRAAPVLPRVFGRLLRRSALRAQGRVSGDRPAPGARGVSQLVQAALPVRLRNVPHGGPRVSPVPSLHASPMERARLAFMEDLRVGLARTPKQIPSKY